MVFGGPVYRGCISDGRDAERSRLLGWYGHAHSAVHATGGVGRRDVWKLLMGWR